MFKLQIKQEADGPIQSAIKAIESSTHVGDGLGVDGATGDALQGRETEARPQLDGDQLESLALDLQNHDALLLLTSHLPTRHCRTLTVTSLNCKNYEELKRKWPLQGEETYLHAFRSTVPRVRDSRLDQRDEPIGDLGGHDQLPVTEEPAGIRTNVFHW